MSHPEEIIDSDKALFVKIDDLCTELGAIPKILETFPKIQDALLALLNATLKNQEYMKSMKQDLQIIKKDLKERMDEGEYLFEQETATTTFTTHDFIAEFDFPVKGFIFKNDGENTIEFGFMSTRQLLDIADERLGTILSGEELKISYNTRRINKIKLRTAAGTSNYRMWVLW